jgi:hemerythrin-like domain-containing protein
MRVTKILHSDQELVARFLAVLGKGLVIASRSKTARPGFFVVAAQFMREYLEPAYLRKEDVLLKALEEGGFPADSGPVGTMRAEHAKSRETSLVLSEAAAAWKAGDEHGRAESVWATSEYTGLMHRHFERLRTLINPLLDQTVTEEGELKIAEELNRIQFAGRADQSLEKYVRIVQMMEEEVGDWED